MAIPEGKIPFGISTNRYNDNIRMDRQDVDRTILTHGGKKWRVLVNAFMNLRAP